MLMLYFSGLIFISFLKPNKLIFSYLFGGISGALFYVVAFNVFPVFDPLLSQSLALGASAAVMSVLFAAVAYAPDFTISLMFIGQLKLKYLAIIFVLIDLLSIRSGNAGGHIAHIGGAMFGLLYGFFLRKNFKIKIKNPHKFKKTKFKTKSTRPETDDEYRRRRAMQNKKMDDVLDKISQNGYKSLTKEEKDFLFRQGKK